MLTYHGYARQYVNPAQLTFNQPSAGARIYDRNGQLLYQFVDDKAGIRTPVKLQDVSPALIAATVATEDSSFFENPGVNFKGLFRATSEGAAALINNGNALEGSGGSSITQQLVKNIYIPQDERSQKSIDRKLRELVNSAELTKTETKEQILEWYLNEISYGGIYSGVDAASEGYFGKPASELTLGEATLLAGIPQSPGQYDPRTDLDAALTRRNEVISLMERQTSIDIGYGRTYVVDRAALEAARSEPVQIADQTFPIQAPHFVLSYIVPQLEEMFGHDALLHDGLVVTTSLDLDLQNRAQQVLETSIDRFEAVSNTHNGAVVVFDAHTGEILVMLGSRDYYRDDIEGEVNNLLALNSPGSTFKPFVYLAGFLSKGWTPDSIIQDTPTSYLQADGTYFSPTNPDGSYHGPITVRTALGNSLNVPAFKAAEEIGPTPIISLAKRMGFTGLADYYGPSIALGGVDFRAMDLAYGYSVFANSGVMVGQDTFAPSAADEKLVQPIGILKVVDGKGKVRFDVDQHRVRQQIVPAFQADSITSILTDPSARCITFGCVGLTVPGYNVAVKTGTSQPFDQSGPNATKIGETWAFGYTPDLVVGVWAGNSNNAPIDHIFSTSISFQAMRDVIIQAYKGRTVTPFHLQTPGPQ
ncbi:MAG TPA: transglycosylase domain-containing protein [Dehalococcoidia bacterium]|nr:transglycosylase domain-containing protein [Dehalococcoidia bacterium]